MTTTREEKESVPFCKGNCIYRFYDKTAELKDNEVKKQFVSTPTKGE